MASLQKSREERAEGEARTAADELAAVRSERHEHDERQTSAGGDSPCRGGILEEAKSFFGAVRDTFTSAKDTAADKAGEASERATETKEATKEKLGEYKDYAAQKAEGGKETMKETKDAALQAAAETKDAVKEKASEVPERTKEAKDRSMESARGYEETTEDKVRKAMESARATGKEAAEYLRDKKEGARQALAGSKKEEMGETVEAARRKGKEVKQRAAERAEDESRFPYEPDEEEKGKSATENIFGSVKSLTDTIKEKMTMPKDIVEHKRDDPAIRERLEKEAENEDDIMLRVKDADQMTGTWFPDVGKLGGEGTGPTGPSGGRRNR